MFGFFSFFFFFWYHCQSNGFKPYEVFILYTVLMISFHNRCSGYHPGMDFMEQLVPCSGSSVRCNFQLSSYLKANTTTHAAVT